MSLKRTQVIKTAGADHAVDGAIKGLTLMAPDSDCQLELYRQVTAVGSVAAYPPLCDRALSGLSRSTFPVRTQMLIDADFAPLKDKEIAYYSGSKLLPRRCAKRYLYHLFGFHGESFSITSNECLH